MPCYTIQRSQVAFLAQTTDADQLTGALESLGFQVATMSSGLVFRKDGRAGSYATATGRLELAEAWDISQIKRAYSEKIIESQAKKFGWQLQWTTNAAGNRQATVLRRG